MPSASNGQTDGAALRRGIATAFPSSRQTTRTRLASSAMVRQARPGETVLQQGDEDHVGLVLTGYVACRRTTLDGRHVTPRVAGVGQLAPVLPLARRPAAIDVVAITDARLAIWSGQTLRGIAMSDCGVAAGILDRALEAFEVVIGGIDGLLYQDALARVARVLTMHRSHFFGPRAILGRADLPALVGTSREMTGRVLRALEAQKVLVRLPGGRLELADAAALERIADHGRQASAADTECWEQVPPQ
jgi:CRP-like cAMP-binding protein